MLYCDINTLIAYSNNGFVNGDQRNGNEKAENITRSSAGGYRFCIRSYRRLGDAANLYLIASQFV